MDQFCIIFTTTRKVTLKLMIEHAKSVSLGVSKDLIVVDMLQHLQNKIRGLKKLQKGYERNKV